jgi:hypothetical protein
MPAQDPGLPGDNANANAIDNVKKRPGRRYMLPDTILEQHDWRASGLPDSDRYFAFIEPTVELEDQARNFAKGDSLKYGERLMDLCLRQIGDKPVGMNQKVLTRWKNAIGVKGRKLLDVKFGSMFIITTEELEALDATGEDVMV